MKDDRRLIEDHLPIEAISKEASREKSVRKGHISTLHLWWARRPLVACRAAVYGALVPASQFVPANGPDNKKQSLGRANAAKFVTELCKYPGNPNTIKKAQEHILDAHAVRLTAELDEAGRTGQWPAWVDEFKWPKDKAKVTRADIEAGRAPRPRVLDMFAGGGSIPLEALRLGCEAYALDLNPVAYIILLCTLVYPQKYGKPDPTARGMTGPKNAKGETTWGGLAEEVRYWGNWVLERVRREIGDLYPPIPDPDYKGKRPEIEFDRKTGRWVAKGKGEGKKNNLLGEEYDEADLPAPRASRQAGVPPGYLTPVAYLWTRTVKCKNPACGATVPLVRQTWLCKKKGRYVALKMVAPKGQKQVRFEVVESRSEKGLGFDPAGFSSAGNATCPFCGTVADSDYVMSQGRSGCRGEQLMCMVCKRAGRSGKVYLSHALAHRSEEHEDILARIQSIHQNAGIAVPEEKIGHIRPSPNARGLSPVTRHGFASFVDLFTMRQLLCLLTFARTLGQLPMDGDPAQQRAVQACLALVLNRVADYCSNFCQWRNNLETVGHTFSRHALAMLWDFAEGSPLFGASGTWAGMLDQTSETLSTLEGEFAYPATVERGSAFALPWKTSMLDAVVTDPPYYDNIPYADVSDFFYVWLKRSIGQALPEHFSSLLTPKKNEATALAARHGGDFQKATEEYESMMLSSFCEAHRVLKTEGTLAIVYAHKTTLGWATLLNAIRKAGFIVTEAWPFDTEMGVRLIAHDTAALASSIFLVARKREADAGIGAYEGDVRPELERIVRERVETLWEQGITGADLVIACVGAGLRAFTRYERVKYANGEEVPAERFLAEVETVVLETILHRLSKEVGGNGNRQTSLAGVDPATRFYILWRYTYRWTELDAGEAIVFANGTHVELDGPGSLSYGSRALIEKKKGKYRLLDFKDRGEDEKLGLPDDGQPAPLIDALHRTLWLMENRPRALAEFLRESRVNREQMRLVAQALAGPALKGSEVADVSPTSELAALSKLTTNWRAVVEDAALTPLEREARRTGQMTLEFDKEQGT